MIRLGGAALAPFDMTFHVGGGDVVFTCKPVTTLSLNVCRSRARARYDKAVIQFDELAEEGAATDTLPDLSDEDVQDGYHETLVGHEMAVEHIKAWTGVGNADGTAAMPVTRANIKAVMDAYPIEIGDIFRRRIMTHQVLLGAAKNASAPSPTGTSVPGAGAPTAKPARKMARRARRAGGAGTDAAAPTRKTPPARKKKPKSGV